MNEHQNQLIAQGKIPPRNPLPPYQPPLPQVQNNNFSFSKSVTYASLPLSVVYEAGKPKQSIKIYNSNLMSNSLLAVSLCTGIIDGIHTGITNDSLSLGAYSVATNLTATVTAFAVGTTVTMILTTLSGGAGAPFAVAIGWYVGYHTEKLVNNYLNSRRNQLIH